MAAGRYDFTIEQGATFRKKITWRDSVNNPQNLTGYQARMELRESVGSTAEVISLTTENDGISLNEAAGEINLFISAADTAAISVKKAVYDLELVNPGGDVIRLLEGKISIRPEVTR